MEEIEEVDSLLLEEEARMLLVLVWEFVDVDLVRDLLMEEGAKAWAAPMRKRREMIRLIMVIVMGALIDSVIATRETEGRYYGIVP